MLKIEFNRVPWIVKGIKLKCQKGKLKIHSNSDSPIILNQQTPEIIIGQIIKLQIHKVKLHKSTLEISTLVWRKVQF